MRRYFKGLLGLVMIGIIILAAGSFFMRKAVIRRLTDKALATSGLVMSKPTSLSVGQSFSQLKLKSRLKRLGYYDSKKPQRAGEFHDNLSNGNFTVFLKSFRFGKRIQQKQGLYSIGIDGDGDISSIVEEKYKQDLSSLWIGSEMLSVLGNSETKAVTPKKFDQFPLHLRQAILAIEDERFYSHLGLDPRAIARAMLVNVKAGRIVQGGSTITQQLGKNLFFSNKRTILRKLAEVPSALFIETAFTKEQILELYMNEIFLGQEGRVAIHGFGEASKAFFNRDVSEISLAQAATLAGIIKGPSSHSPRRHPKRATKRRKLVLQKMQELGFITKAEFKKAANEKIKVISSSRTNRKAPYFIDYIRRTLPEIAPAELFETSNVKVYTGLDTEYQRCAEKAVTDGLKDIERKYPRFKKLKGKTQAALIAVEPASGSTLAWVGGRSFSSSQFDRVSQAKRQPGSAFKPFVFLTAFDKNLNNYKAARTTSLLLDKPITIKIRGSKDWSPKNYDKKYNGEVTIRETLARSLNIPTVNLAMKVGIGKIAKTAELFGFGENLPVVPSLALGAGEVSPLELAKAYNALANGGRLLDLRSTLAIEHSNELYEVPLKEKVVASEPAVFVVNDLMRSVIDRGTARVVRRLGYTRPAAGKTGTSNDSRDSWFAGFSPHLLAVVWVGFDDGKPLKLTGSQAAAPIWARFMKCTEPMEPDLDFVPPPGVVYRDVDMRNGRLDNGYCDSRYVEREVFVEGTEPITNSACAGIPPKSRITRRQDNDNSSSKQKIRGRAEGIVSSIIRSLFGE